MSGHATYCPGVLNMHFSYQHTGPPGTRFGGSIRCGRCWQGRRAVHETIIGAVQAQRLRYTLPKQPGERLLVARFHDIAQKDEAQVTIERLRPRRIGQGLLEDSLDSLMTTDSSAGGRMTGGAIRP